MVRQVCCASVRILVALLFVNSIVDNGNCENTNVNRRNRHYRLQYLNPKRFSDDHEGSQSPLVRTKRHVDDTGEDLGLSYSTDAENGVKNVGGETLLDLESPMYDADQDIEESSHVRVKRDRSKEQQYYKSSTHSKQRHVEEPADFLEKTDSKSSYVGLAAKNVENTQMKVSTAFFNPNKSSSEGLTSFSPTEDNATHSSTFVPFDEIEADSLSNRHKPNISISENLPSQTRIYPVTETIGLVSNETQLNASTNSHQLNPKLSTLLADNEDSSLALKTSLTATLTNESSRKIALSDIYPDVSSFSLDSVPKQLVRKKRNEDEEYDEKAAMDSRQARAINDISQEREIAKILDDDDQVYDDFYAEDPKIRHDRETSSGSDKMLDTESADETDLAVNDFSVNAEDRSNADTMENPEGVALLRRGRHGRANVYSEPFVLTKRDASIDDFQGRVARKVKRSDWAIDEMSRNDESSDTGETGVAYGTDDFGADQEEAQFEYRPLRHARRQIGGEPARYRRRMAARKFRRAQRRAKKPSKKRKKKRKGRKGGAGKRHRKSPPVNERSLDSSRVVGEMQVESKIEKRESSDGKTEIEVAKRDVGEGLAPPREVIIASRGKSLRLDDENDESKRDREKAEGEVLRDFVKVKEDSGGNEQKVNDVEGKVENRQRSNEESRIVANENDAQAKLQNVQGEISGTNEKSDNHEGSSSSVDEEKAALNIDARIKRLIEAYREIPLSDRDAKLADQRRAEETDSRVRIAGGASRSENSMENLENHDADDSASKARVKRHEIGERKHASRGNVDAKELRYYENVREPGPTSGAQGEAPKESVLVVDKFRGDRAAKSIEEIRELAEKLVGKATELRSYVNEENERRAGRRSKKRADAACYTNATRVEAPTTERGAKIVESCGFAQSVRGAIVDPATRAKRTFAEEYQTRRLKSESSRPEPETAERQPETAEERRKRRSRKWDRWTDWSSCSVTCGKGRQIRWRHCLRDCNTAETEMEEKACQLPACPPGKFLGIF